MNPAEALADDVLGLAERSQPVAGLDEIVARATRELWTYGDFDTVQRANTVIIRRACLAAVESAFKAWEEGGDLAGSKMRDEIREVQAQLESYQKGRT